MEEVGDGLRTIGGGSCLSVVVVWRGADGWGRVSGEGRTGLQVEVGGGAGATRRLGKCLGTAEDGGRGTQVGIAVGGGGGWWWGRGRDAAAAAGRHAMWMVGGGDKERGEGEVEGTRRGALMGGGWGDEGEEEGRR